MPRRPSPASLSDRQHPHGPPLQGALAAGCPPARRCPPAQWDDRINPPTNPPLPAPREEGQSSPQSHRGSSAGLSASHLCPTCQRLTPLQEASLFSKTKYLSNETENPVKICPGTKLSITSLPEEAEIPGRSSWSHNWGEIIA